MRLTVLIIARALFLLEKCVFALLQSNKQYMQSCEAFRLQTSFVNGLDSAHDALYRARTVSANINDLTRAFLKWFYRR